MRFVAIWLALFAFTAQPAAAAASSADLAGLEQQLNSFVSGRSADVGIAALDLNTGEEVSIKGNTPFPMASTVKVAIAALYLAQVDHGRRSLDDSIDGQSVRSLMRRMLIYSDNRAADILFKDVGGPTAVHDWLRDNGVNGVRVDRTIAQLLSARRDLWDRRDSSTPVAMVELLRRIYSAELIKPESRNYLLDLMSQCQTGKNRMKALASLRRRSRTQDGNANRPRGRRRLHHHARRSSHRGGDLCARRLRPTADHRRGGPRNL